MEGDVRIMDCTIQNCVLHHHTSICHALEVDNIIMYDYSSISHSARVVSSIVGPDASIAGGECHHSLLGPMVGFHHTSLLIATIWPFGRGNIAYGAKIGAPRTHLSRTFKVTLLEKDGSASSSVTRPMQSSKVHRWRPRQLL